MKKSTTKLLKNLSLLASQSLPKQPVVLLMSGVFNPIHKQHVNILGIAKKEIEIKDSSIKVVAGYFSPCSNIYAKRKLKDEAINGDQRIEMIKLALEESDWIDIDEWEIKHPDNFEKHLPTYLVVKQLSNYLNSDLDILQYCNNNKN